MATDLDELLRGNPALWRGRDGGSANTMTTGFTALDTVLPGGGWPVGALVEMITERFGIGELRLLLPAMAALTDQRRWLVWSTPPFVPYAPALSSCGIDLNRLVVLRTGDDNTLWSLEKTLRAEACGMALAWPGGLAEGSMRRLQLAAEAGNSMAVLIRSTDHGRSPAALRLRLQARDGGLDVHILKARGGQHNRHASLVL